MPASDAANGKSRLNGPESKIRICYDLDEDCRTLEPQLLKANSRDRLNAILGTTYTDDAALLKHMAHNKTQCALEIFRAEQILEAPEYILKSIE